MEINSPPERAPACSPQSADFILKIRQRIQHRRQFAAGDCGPTIADDVSLDPDGFP
jgi:hypothetical protein